MTDFQVGDRVSVEGVVTAVIGTQIVVHPDRSPMGGYYFRPDALTLVERPKRKLRVGSVWERGAADDHSRTSRFIWSGDGFIDKYGVIHPRGFWDFNSVRDNWREVPVEELEREADR